MRYGTVELADGTSTKQICHQAGQISVTWRAEHDGSAHIQSVELGADRSDSADAEDNPL